MSDQPTIAPPPDEWGADLPYPDPDTGATSGHSGVDTSRDRAHREDADGTTSVRQSRALQYLNIARSNGVTWKELADIAGWHHGQASGVLSGLHKAGRIARLAETRNRCHVYVALAHVADRETQNHGGHDWKARAETAERTLADITRYIEEGDTVPAWVKRDARAILYPDEVL